MQHTATYSPEDDKIRIYPAYRLPADEYKQLKEVGYAWAPKQECFYAVWTPNREAVALQFAEEIEDEDKSLVDRAEERADRFENYSDNRAKDAARATNAVKAIADNIPFGQPILVGHHSEKHARKHAQKIENGMKYAVKMWETSEYWTSRATGAIAHAKYKERPDVRARRIKGLEADLRKQTKYLTDAEKDLAQWEKVSTIEEGRRLAGYNQAGRLPCVKHPKFSHYRSAYDVLQPQEEQYTGCEAWTLEQVKERARVYYPRQIAVAQVWINHINNRLAYERAMLNESGGTAADQVKPEKGGACRCWATDRGRGCWSKIIKVNKVSVTVMDNWGNGGRDFTRNMPFDKLTALMSAAQVEEARAEGRILAENERTLLISEDVPAKQPERKLEPENEDLKAMKETLKAGIQTVAAPQLFPTPPEIASQMVELAEIQKGHTVLEPSAGTGNILQAIMNNDTGIIVAVEINQMLCDRLKNEYPLTDVHCLDFLQYERGNYPVDRIIMNPPFENGVDIKHIRHAETMLKPGGKLVALCANGPRQQEAFKGVADHWEVLPAGSFENQGTGVNVALMVLSKPEQPKPSPIKTALTQMMLIF